MSKKILISLLVLLMFFSCMSLSACHKKEESKVPTEAAVRYDTLEDIKKELEFDIKVPKDLNVEAYTIRKKATIQVVFDGGFIRKAKTEKSVGNKVEGTESETLVIGENNVKLATKGDKVKQATWRANGFSYCLYFQLGKDRDTAISYISQIK